ncbi:MULTISPECIES: helix-turn-helix domain-containing protein [Streptomyces]|uniref:HTH cro/C1-type domain-containing protein n=2 Tax=Streptomyces TaxID=1883 RepID=A0A0W7X9S3_9ACTN|nr:MULTISPECIES: helix-turn-helix transcriptional regulator [Streptomyces]KUF19515.1 hypothetical protein AT728_03795 [Streptomyces silvensis]MVO85935.1 helix-turn-helix domain-containing protein [Streptomyces typhae]
MTFPGDAGAKCKLEESVGRAVRARRQEFGMTQVGLAERTGMTQGAISRLERGKCMPTIPVLERIAEALDSVLLVAITPSRPVMIGFRNLARAEAAAG